MCQKRIEIYNSFDYNIDDLLIMEEGHAVIHGKTKDIFRSPKYVTAARLTGYKNIAWAQKVDIHRILVSEWNLTMTLEQEIPDSITHIGVRAHDFIPSWNKAIENEIFIKEIDMEEMPFERKYYIRTHKESMNGISWFVQRNQWEELEEHGMPKALKIPEDKILLLQN